MKFRIRAYDAGTRFSGWVLEVPELLWIDGARVPRGIWCPSFVDAVRTMDAMIKRSNGRSHDRRPVVV